MTLFLILFFSFTSGFLMGGVCVYFYFQNRQRVENKIEEYVDDDEILTEDYSVLEESLIEIRNQK